MDTLQKIIERLKIEMNNLKISINSDSYEYKLCWLCDEFHEFSDFLLHFDTHISELKLVSTILNKYKSVFKDIKINTNKILDILGEK